jgi:small-conductance mechanosensitive channel
MDIQQAINLALLRRFREYGIEFAYPTRTLHVKSDASQVHLGSTALPPHIARVAAK